MGKGVYLARHGQTAYNLEGRFQGQLPVPLDDTGRTQAAELAERAAEHGFAALWSSTLLRAQETAEIVAARIGLEPTAGRAADGDGRRRLDRPGVRRGAGAKRPSCSPSSSPATRAFAFPGGESFAEQEVRVGAALDDIERGRPAGAGGLSRHGHPRRAVGARRALAADRSARANGALVPLDPAEAGWSQDLGGGEVTQAS